MEINGLALKPYIHTAVSQCMGMGRGGHVCVYVVDHLSNELV